MTKIRINTEHVRDAGRQFAGESSRLSGIAQTLQQAISSLDTGAWDGVSRARAEPHLDRVQPHGVQAIAQLEELGRTLERVAGVFEQEDTTAARNLTGMSWLAWEMGDGTPVTGTITSGPPDDGDPDFSGVDNTEGVTYGAVDGQPFLEGAQDGTDIHPNDAAQGQIGDCYLIASLAAIAQQNPQVIRNMIRDNGDGTYTVTLHRRASIFSSELEPVDVVVTPDFPLRNGRPWFARPGDAQDGQRELWPMLIEKAYAQQHGGYGRIEGGFAHVTMEELSGVHSERFSPTSASIEDLSNHLGEGHAVTVSSLYDWKIEHDGKTLWDIPDASNRHPLYQNGTVVASHEYYVTSVNIEDNTVSIRNPWGWGVEEIVLPFEDFQTAFQRVSVNPLDGGGTP